MSLLGIDTSWVQVAIGVVLVIGMLINNYVTQRENNRSFVLSRSMDKPAEGGDQA